MAENSYIQSHCGTTSATRKDATGTGAGRLFIGHMVFYLGSADGPPLQSFATDWDEALLPKKEALERFRAGMSHQWAGDIAEKIVFAGAAMLHFYVGEGPGGKAKFSVDDCDPRCPAMAEARALLSPPMGTA